MKKDHIIRTLMNIGIVLAGLFVFSFAVSVVAILESEALVHSQQASVWYVRMLNSLSINSLS